MDIISPKYSRIAWYKRVTGGYMPRLRNVPGFDAILVHPGSSAEDTRGCILVGKNTVKGGLTSSRATFEELYKLMKAAHDKGGHVYITIK